MSGTPRSAVALLLALVLTLFGTSALEFAPRAARAPSTWCCCAETGVDARCTCEGDCCQHDPVPTLCSTASAPEPGVACLSTGCRRAPVHTRATPVLEPFLPVTQVCVLRDFTRDLPFGAPGVRAPERALPSPERPPDSPRG